MVHFGEFWFFCLRGKQRHPRVQLATLERPNPHALAATALERQLCRSPLLVTRRNNRSEYGRVCGVEIGCRRLDRFTRGFRYQWVDFDVICPFSTVESVKNPPYAIGSRQKMVNFTAACSGVSIRKHCVCAYAHKNRRLCDSAYPDDPHKSVYSSKTERAIELKLSRTM